MGNNFSIEEAILKCLGEWQVKEGETLEIVGDFVFPVDFPAFVGHFPGNPILPAFVQVALVRVLIQLALGKVLAPINTGRLKFSGVVRPNEMLRVVLRLQTVEQGWAVGFTLTKGDEPVASGNLDFSEKCKMNGNFI